ncbi:MAG TPA: tRNA preQ1(34) S-adenosylmethionine ribosyltransferase-isomerase QueA [Pseudomonadales bacterium]|nr:tRNA preQ1(34) S-adenosylmethionine ribosyltransferase-isomerase QueA [Pseudomonadales bacterium]
MPLTRSDFRYVLPERLIAQTPLPNRTDSRLMVIDPQSGSIEHRTFDALPDLLSPNDLLVLNDTRVIRARLHGRKDSGGAAELLIERIEGERRALCQVRVSKPLKPGRSVLLEPRGERATVIDRSGDLYRFEFERAVDDVLDACGQVPLPPYIARPPDEFDEARYQTVFAERRGSVAAPTAGLHFDHALLDRCVAAGVAVARVTLHVGAGTFQPMRVQELAAHRMHGERMSVSSTLVDAVAACRARGGRVVAIGTTVVRALESAALGGALAPFDGETDIFIHPGFRFRVVDALVTNFHLPESTLLMLVAAFAGSARVLAAYETAVQNEYRFFSYGDAMFITQRCDDAI